jgi:hypothetical protein
VGRTGKRKEEMKDQGTKDGKHEAKVAGAVAAFTLSSFVLSVFLRVLCGFFIVRTT